jgi:hypothetical protein
VRLGASASQARRQLETGAPGSFRVIASGEDAALEWTPSNESAELMSARLEFHLGQLVALRLRLSPGAAEADGPDLEVSRASVLARAPLPERGVELTWIARGCPTHAAELRRLIERPN